MDPPLQAVRSRLYLVVPDVASKWFASKGWRPFEFQCRTWTAYRSGYSGLVHAPTGMGKTYAVWLGPVAEWVAQAPPNGERHSPPLRVLWITPLRALANDIGEALRAPIDDLHLPWSVELRTGDTSASLRKRQRERLPSALVTTPESLSLLLSYPETQDTMRELRCVVVDEWHELLGTKRGVQVELALARLRRWRPNLRTWGLSATLGNLDQAMQVLLGTNRHDSPGCLISCLSDKTVYLHTLQPADMERFPWAGHIGMRLLPQVLDALGKARSTLLFTNTRAQAELWFREILLARPDWIGQIALHHGSLDREIREQVEQMLRAGTLRCVVCTSSLDLGVDFPAVDQVIQVGSPKAIGRILQRAGRSGHQPNLPSTVICVPTHAFELVEYAAARKALDARRVEPRQPLDCPVDVLAQHLVTIALGGGFQEQDLLAEVRGTHAFSGLTDEQWRWTMAFVTHGGTSLQAYPRYARIVQQDGRFAVTSPQMARLHRLSIGTIASDSQMNVRMLSGRSLGTLEESFIARLQVGDCFVFAGKVLELALVHDMTAYVRKASKPKGMVPRWSGNRIALSAELTCEVRMQLAQAEQQALAGPEMRWVRPILQIQATWSRIPQLDELLIEYVHTREGDHLFVYPFEGRSVHEGLAALAAYRLTRLMPRSVSVLANDYGFGLLSPNALELDEDDWRRVLSRDNLLEDLQACLNATEMARRRFRDIARVAGLIFSGYPGQARSTRHIQASSDLFFDVFREYDPDNLLLQQARREVLEGQLEIGRLTAALRRMESMRIVMAAPGQLTPLAFPIWAEHIHAQVSSEKWIDRVRRMSLRLETAATATATTTADKVTR